MARLMSVALTTAAVRERRKTVTRRKGWWLDTRGRRLLLPGDQLTLCPKVMGRRGAPLERICTVEVVSVRREVLGAISTQPGELAREGLPHLTASEFIDTYFVPQGVTALDDVTRIEWRYLDPVRVAEPQRELWDGAADLIDTETPTGATA